jgi:hypothetical protein
MRASMASYHSNIRNHLYSPAGRLQGSPSQHGGTRHMLEEQRLSVLDHLQPLAQLSSVDLHISTVMTD